MARLGRVLLIARRILNGALVYQFGVMLVAGDFVGERIFPSIVEVYSGCGAEIASVARGHDVLERPGERVQLIQCLVLVKDIVVVILSGGRASIVLCVGRMPRRRRAP